MDILTDITARNAALRPDRLALDDLGHGRRLTHRGLNEAAARAARVLESQGVGPGDRVAILCRNRAEFFELMFACAKLGAIFVPLNWRLTAGELAALVADCTPGLLLFGREDGEVAARLADTCELPTIGLDEDYALLRQAASPHPGRLAWPGDETWYLIYTSGTTGRPKAVIQTYRMALVNFINLSQAIGLGQHDTTLNFLPLFHTAGINLHTLPTLMAGGCARILPGFDAGRTLDLVNAGSIDVFLGVPTVYRELSQHPGFATCVLGRVRHWASGGAPLPPDLAAVFAERGAPLCNGFGMTETGPTAFLADAETALAKPGSVGTTQWLVEARIAGPDDQPLKPGETGEFQFFGPGLTPGYWRRPDETAALYTADGWLRSGDLGWIDEDGCGHVTGRLKDMYISGGENVFPVEIETALLAHPDVEDVAVRGEPDATWGEAGVAYLIPRPGTAPAREDLASWCRDRLAGYKIPRDFHLCDDFPRTASGKVQKHRLGGVGAGLEATPPVSVG
ncbi:class I adenylate-forming enzyme family protein [Maricaulis sp. CAU 1757]